MKNPQHFLLVEALFELDVVVRVAAEQHGVAVYRKGQDFVIGEQTHFLIVLRGLYYQTNFRLTPILLFQAQS